jgi:hypothetical protein
LKVGQRKHTLKQVGSLLKLMQQMIEVVPMPNTEIIPWSGLLPPEIG